MTALPDVVNLRHWGVNTAPCQPNRSEFHRDCDAKPDKGAGRRIIGRILIGHRAARGLRLRGPLDRQSSASRSPSCLWAGYGDGSGPSGRRSANLFGSAFSRRICHRQSEKGKIPGRRCLDQHQNEPGIFLVASKPSPCASRAPANRRPPLSPGATRDRKSFGKCRGFSCCSWTDDNEATNLRNRNPDLTLLSRNQG